MRLALITAGRLMDNAQALEILKNHNVWRRGASETPTHPKLLGEALDYVIELMESKQ